MQTHRFEVLLVIDLEIILGEIVFNVDRIKEFDETVAKASIFKVEHSVGNLLEAQIFDVFFVQHHISLEIYLLEEAIICDMNRHQRQILASPQLGIGI